MDVVKVISGGKDSIKKNLIFLANEYKKQTGRIVCLRCPSDVRNMIVKLKILSKMSSFQFKELNAQYKATANSRKTISNNGLTDEDAIAFLAIKPERIKLFSVKPDNWEQLVEAYVKGIDVEDVEVVSPSKKVNDAIDQDALDLAINSGDGDAVAKVVNDAAKVAGVGSDDLLTTDDISKIAEMVGGDDVDVIVSKDDIDAMADPNEISDGMGNDDCDCSPDDADADGNSEPCEHCKEEKRKELMLMKLSELREAYPEIRDTSKEGFVNQILG